MGVRNFSYEILAQKFMHYVRSVEGEGSLYAARSIQRKEARFHRLHRLHYTPNDRIFFQYISIHHFRNNINSLFLISSLQILKRRNKNRKQLLTSTTLLYKIPPFSKSRKRESTSERINKQKKKRIESKKRRGREMIHRQRNRGVQP